MISAITVLVLSFTIMISSSVISEEGTTLAQTETENSDNEGTRTIKITGSQENDDETEEISPADENMDTKIDHNASQNLVISKYFKAFEEFREKYPDKYTKESLEIIKLLIAQSWIYTLKPDVNLVKIVIPVNEDTDLETVKNYIVIQIKDHSSNIAVGDAIIVYANSIQEKIKEELENRAKENKNREKLDETNLFLEFHRVTLKMCLQSYVLDFLEKPYDETITIKSSSGHDTKIFSFPPLDEDNFEKLSFEADFEDEE